MAGYKSSLMRLYRIMHYLYMKHVPILPYLFMKYIRVVYSMELPPSVLIGEGSYFIHNGLGCVIHARTCIGKNVKIYQNVTLEGRNGVAAPVIGNDVVIGAGACVLGKVRIGEHAKIGANAVVIQDVPSNKTAVGVPSHLVE